MEIKMKKILLTLILGMFLISFASAEYSVLKPQAQGECINLPQVSDASSCNITSITFPVNSSYALRNVEMQKNGTHFNYTFCSTNTLGVYTVDGVCDDAVWVYDFEVTTTGIFANNLIPLFLLISSIVLFIIGVTLENPPCGFFSGILFLMSGMYLMIYGFGNISDLYTQSFALVVIAVGSITSILAGYSWVED
jgi:hypothetical protein